MSDIDIDPSTAWPAQLSHDAALRDLHNRLSAIEALVEPGVLGPTEGGIAPVTRGPALPDYRTMPDYRGQSVLYPTDLEADPTELAKFREWVDAGRPSAVGLDAPAPGPGFTGAPYGSPAAPPATGAGPDAGPVSASGPPAIASTEPDPDSEPDAGSKPGTARKSNRHGL